MAPKLPLHPDLKEIVLREKAATIDLLRLLVDTNSFARNPDGINRVGEVVASVMPTSFVHRVVTNQLGVKHHVFVQTGNGGAPIVLAGHLDTLCPPDPAFDNLVEDGPLLRGPGVNDMKGGITVLVQALHVLAKAGQLAKLPLVCIFNGDEELGSPTSYTLFTEWGGRARYALVFECGGPAGTVVTTRKGIMRYRLYIQGQPHHFGNLVGPKVSAIEELAHKILAIEALNQPDGSIVANVGRIVGGIAANAVAEKAEMDFEVRYWRPEMEEKALAEIETVARTSKVPGCCLSLDRLSYRPPMQPTEKSRALFKKIVARGRALGMCIMEEKRGGVSDACWLAHVGIPTIDGMGPLGDGDFTRDEHIYKETLFDRIELVADLLLDLQDSA